MVFKCEFKECSCNLGGPCSLPARRFLAQEESTGSDSSQERRSGRAQEQFAASSRYAMGPWCNGHIQLLCIWDHPQINGGTREPSRTSQESSCCSINCHILGKETHKETHREWLVYPYHWIRLCLVVDQFGHHHASYSWQDPGDVPKQVEEGTCVAMDLQ